MVGVVGIVAGVVIGAVVVGAGEESWLQQLHDASKYVLAAQGIDTAWP